MMVTYFFTKKLNIIFLSALFCSYFCAPLSAHAAVNTKKIGEANRLYAFKEYDQALEIYNELLLKDPDPQLLNYNAAAAYYKKGDYKKAEELFSKALVTQDTDFEAKTAYNIGNCFFKQSQSKENNRIENAIDDLKEALVYYQRSIELNQKDEDARFNYEVTDKKIEELKQKLEKKQAEAGQGQDSDDQKEEQKESLESQNIKQEQQEANGSFEKNEEERGKKDKETQKDEVKRDSPEQKNGKAQEMSRQEAEMLIDAYAREGLRLHMADLHKAQNEPEAEKDW